MIRLLSPKILYSKPKHDTAYAYTKLEPAKKMKHQNKRYETGPDQDKELSFVKYEDMIVDRNKKTSSKTPAHNKKKSSNYSRFINKGIHDLEDKENQNCLMEGRVFNKQSYTPGKILTRTDSDNSDTDEYYKESKIKTNLFTNESHENKLPEAETKTQNTQDYRKNEDFNIENINYNFSAEKPVHNFTRFELYPDQEEQRPSEMDSYEMSYDVSKRAKKNIKMVSRYDSKYLIYKYNGRSPLAEHSDHNEMLDSNILFSQEKISNYQQDDQKRMSRSFDSWSQNNANIEDFLKRTSHSFLNNEISFEKSQLTTAKPEISCDNPLEMDSITGSKQLELADLEVQKSFKTNAERFENSDQKFKESREVQSRNDERQLSHDNSSI
jgi:hypothetical protein